jgi:hypothetical protein
MPKTPKTPSTRARLVPNAISPRRRRWAANPSASTCLTRAASCGPIARRGRGRITDISPPPEERYQNVILANGETTHIGLDWPRPGPHLDRRLSPPGHQALESVTVQSVPASRLRSRIRVLSHERGPAEVAEPADNVVLLDARGAVIGEAPRTAVHTTATPRHLAFSLYLFDVCSSRGVPSASGPGRAYGPTQPRRPPGVGRPDRAHRPHDVGLHRWGRGRRPTDLGRLHRTPPSGSRTPSRCWATAGFSLFGESCTIWPADTRLAVVQGCTGSDRLGRHDPGHQVCPRPRTCGSAAALSPADEPTPCLDVRGS